MTDRPKFEVISHTQDATRSLRHARNDYFNTVLLMGKVILEPKAVPLSGRDGVWCYFTMQTIELDPDGFDHNDTATLVMVKAFTHVAQKALNRVGKLDTVFVFGKLRRDHYASEKLATGPLRARGALCVHAQGLRVIPKRGGEIRDSTRVKKARLKRLLELERHFDPKGTWVSPEALQKYDLAELIDDDEDFS